LTETSLPSRFLVSCLRFHLPSFFFPFWSELNQDGRWNVRKIDVYLGNEGREKWSVPPKERKRGGGTHLSVPFLSTSLSLRLQIHKNPFAKNEIK
jgi:hypothetical protein